MKYIYGRKPVLESLNNGSVDKLYVLKSDSGSIRKILAIAKEQKLPIANLNRKKLDEMANGQNHQGVVALVSDFNYLDIDEIIEKSLEKSPARLLILDRIEDPHNLGAISRSALFMGFDGIIIPKHRCAIVNDTVYKASAGAIEDILVAQVTNINQSIEKLKENGFWIYAADLNGEDIRNCDLSGNIAIVIGNEGSGISKTTLKNSDKIISIPNRSNFDSLNASVAASIIMYETMRNVD